MWLIVCFCVFGRQAWRLHEHRNISVSLWSSKQTKPANAGQWAAGWSLRSALLMPLSVDNTWTVWGSHIGEGVTILFLYKKRKKSYEEFFFAQFLSIFPIAMETLISLVTSPFFVIQWSPVLCFSCSPTYLACITQPSAYKSVLYKRADLWWSHIRALCCNFRCFIDTWTDLTSQSPCCIPVCLNILEFLHSVMYINPWLASQMFSKAEIFICFL